MSTRNPPPFTEAQSDIIARLVAKIRATDIAPLQKRIADLEARPMHQLKYLGTWTPGRYQPGEFTTDHGSLWFCERETTSRPGTDANWRLAVKQGTFK
jgi:hypothetical protein